MTTTTIATSPTATPTIPRTIAQRVNDLIAHIQQGRVIDAMHEFYDRDVSMRENANPPSVGLDANIEREKKFLAQVKTWKGFTVTGLAVNGDTAFIENVIEFVSTDGRDVRLEQVSVQRWKNGRIVSERFYSNAGA